MQRYPASVIVLHWLLAPMILLALYMGQDIAQLSNDLDLKVDRLIVHMSAGLVIALLFLIRLFANRLHQQKTRNTTNQYHSSKAAVLVHRFIYLLVFGIAATGLGIAAQVDMLNIIEIGETMPESLPNLPARNIHEGLTQLLLATIALHTLAALYHQFIRRDRLLSKMWFSKKSRGSDERVI